MSKKPTKVMTIEDVRQMAKIFANQPIQTQPRKLYFTQSQVDRMKSAGNKIDLENWTIDGYPFEIIEDPFRGLYQGGDNFVERILKEFENVPPTKKAP